MDPVPAVDELTDAVARAASLVRTAGRLAVLTGAGISAESGLATFRGKDGLWEGQRPEDVATPMAFRRDPQLVWRFYHHRRANLAKVRPNPGHTALVALEKHFTGERFTLVTQNVDGLHQAAGSRQVLEIHGSIRVIRCTGCGQAADRGTETLPDLPRCDDCGELLRPGVVWFHEQLPEDVWMRAQRAVAASDCFLVVGTSAVVYPAAGLIDLAKTEGASVIEVNVERTPASGTVDVGLYGPSGQLLPRLVETLKLDNI